jgi:uncharacterized protein
VRVDRHRVTAEAFTAFARFGGSLDAVRLVASARLSKTMLVIQFVLRTAQRAGHPDAHRVRAAYDLLAQVQQYAPEAVDAVLRYPLVGAQALRCALLLRRGDRAAAPAFLTRVAAAAAIGGAVSATVDLGQVADRVYLPGLGTATTGTGAATVTVYGDGAEIDVGRRTIAVPADPQRDDIGWHGLRRVSGGGGRRRFDVLLDSTMPRSLPATLATEDALSDEDASAWRERLLGGWRLLVRERPAVADEVAEVLQVVAPMRSRSVNAASATLGDAFGCVVMSLPQDDVSAAVTLTHEVQHAKLTGLTDLATLVDGDSAARFYAPWREDPRPALGLVHGLYAHAAVAGFWRRHRELCAPEDRFDADVEYARWWSASREVADCLLRGDALTSVGRRLVTVVAGQLAEWAAEPPDPEAEATARRRAEGHRSSWAARQAVQQAVPPPGS